MAKSTVAFIGLGVMGFPMAGHLANTGHMTRVYNRTGSKAENGRLSIMAQLMLHLAKPLKVLILFCLALVMMMI